MVYIYRLFDGKYSDITRYIGKTCRKNINSRLIEHICHSKEAKLFVHNWINKVLSENRRPCIELLDVVENEDWEFWEKWYILKYSKNPKNRLTNIEAGGKSTTIRKYNKKGTNKNAKSIDMFDINGNYIKTYKSVSLAADKNNFNRHVIAACCRGNQTKAYGYKWKYSTDSDFKKSIHKRARTVYQYSIDNELLNIFKSVIDASKKTGIQAGNIRNCLYGSSNYTDKYVFKFN